MSACANGPDRRPMELYRGSALIYGGTITPDGGELTGVEVVAQVRTTSTDELVAELPVDLDAEPDADGVWTYRVKEVDTAEWPVAMWPVAMLRFGVAINTDQTGWQIVADRPINVKASPVVQESA